jgi:hypothetical protein
VARPRKARVELPPHVHAVKARGKDYYYFHAHRGTAQEGRRIKIPGSPLNANGSINEDWWAACRELTGEQPQGPRGGSLSARILA